MTKINNISKLLKIFGIPNGFITTLGEHFCFVKQTLDLIYKITRTSWFRLMIGFNLKLKLFSIYKL